MSISKNLQKRPLECLRLASELLYLARETPYPELKAQFTRMAAMWSNQVNHAPSEDGVASRA